MARFLRLSAICCCFLTVLLDCTSDAPGEQSSPSFVPPSRDPLADAAIPPPTSPDAAESGTTPSTCAPPVHKTFMASLLSLKCAGPQPLFDEPIGLEGFALARVILDVQHYALSSVIHYWSAGVGVGDPAHPDAVGYYLGDDVCPNKIAKQRMNLGYGFLSPGNDRIRVSVVQGSSPCTDDTLKVLDGAQLDVWVEDARPECRKKSIAVGSHYKSNGITKLYNWTTSFTPIISTSLELSRPAKLRLMGTVEGTPSLNPNTACGQESATLAMAMAFDEKYELFTRDVLPASGGMGHVVLSGSVERSALAGSHQLVQHVASNFTPQPGQAVTTGGCCGDATIAIVADAP